MTMCQSEYHKALIKRHQSNRTPLICRLIQLQQLSSAIAPGLAFDVRIIRLRYPIWHAARFLKGGLSSSQAGGLGTHLPSGTARSSKVDIN